MPGQAYEPVIGLEVHVQLLTDSKAFCACSTKFGSAPNSNVCPVCLGLPGVLPVLNRRVVDYAIRLGLAAGCSIAERSVFARKNYFYPDLPKGYQISQYEHPLCTGGQIDIDLENGGRKSIRLTRIHIEEDAGKLIHGEGGETLVDVNRCGVPLLEVVSEPDLRSPREAAAALRKIHQIVTYLGICDGNMEEGSLRCDANISVRRQGESRFGTKTEVKNMNSFRNVERAIEFEVGRQIRLLDAGEQVEQETLLWDADRGVALSMRSKEEAHDYRYFPDPDLPPLIVDEPWIERIRKELPEHPTTRRDRFVSVYALPAYDADVLTAEKPVADYFEEAVASMGSSGMENAKQVSNWVMTEVLRVVREKKAGIDQFPVSPANLGALIKLIGAGTISGKIAKDVFAEMLIADEDPAHIVERKGLSQMSDEGALSRIVDEVLERNGPQVEKFRAGNEKVFGFFVGEVMKATRGKANPALVNALLKAKLS